MGDLLYVHPRPLLRPFLPPDLRLYLLYQMCAKRSFYSVPFVNWTTRYLLSWPQLIPCSGGPNRSVWLLLTPILNSTLPLASRNYCHPWLSVAFVILSSLPNLFLSLQHFCNPSQALWEVLRVVTASIKSWMWVIQDVWKNG